MQFKDSKYESFENDGTVKAFVVRSGDASHVSTVRCYTRQDTAKVMDDYFERPNTNASVITFMPGKTLVSSDVLELVFKIITCYMML